MTGSVAADAAWAHIPPDDPAWVNYEGAVRLRYNAVRSGLVELEVSVDNGDGTFSVSKFNLQGALVSTVQTASQWPS